MNIRLFKLACAAAAILLSNVVEAQIVTLNHHNASQSHANLILKPGEEVTFVVTNTNTVCYSYNATVVPYDPAADSDEVSLSLTHESGVSAYKITAKKLPFDSCKSSTLPDREWNIPVSTLGWKIAFSGAFVMNELTNPVFFLEPGAQNMEDGFFVRQDVGAEDSTDRGLAVLIHLFNDSFREWYGIQWAPLTFGIDLDEDTKYYMGTSFKFEEAMYLTLGYVFGDRERLPNGLELDSFTTNPNAVDTLGSKSGNAFFIGFSYRFGETDLKPKLFDRFNKTAAPAVTPGGS